MRFNSGRYNSGRFNSSTFLIIGNLLTAYVCMELSSINTVALELYAVESILLEFCTQNILVSKIDFVDSFIEELFNTYTLTVEIGGPQC